MGSGSPALSSSRQAPRFRGDLILNGTRTTLDLYATEFFSPHAMKDGCTLGAPRQDESLTDRLHHDAGSRERLPRRRTLVLRQCVPVGVLATVVVSELRRVLVPLVEL